MEDTPWIKNRNELKKGAADGFLFFGVYVKINKKINRSLIFEKEIYFF